MKAFAKMAAVLGLVGVFGATAFGQAPTSTPPIAPTAGAKAPTTGTMVKGYTRKGKNGKMITVKPHMRGARQAGTAASSKVAVKGYTRKGKNGKMITVKGYQRTAPNSKSSKPTTPVPPGQVKKP